MDFHQIIQLFFQALCEFPAFIFLGFAELPIFALLNIEIKL